MADFVQAVITTDSAALLDTGIDAMNVNLEAAGMPSWAPADADQLVIAMGIVAGWATDNAGIISVVLPAIFRAFVTQLCNIPYSQGTYATVLSTWTFTSPAPVGGYQITAGTAVLIDGQTFYVQTEVDASVGNTTASATLVANQVGSAFNGLGGVDEVVQPNDQIDWVQSVTVAGVTSGGGDQESDEEFQDKSANLLTLQKISIVNAADYPVALQSDIATQITGVTVGRATALDGYYPAPRVLSTGGAGSSVVVCTVVSGQAAVTINTPLVGQVPHAGASVTGADIPSSTTVLASPAPTAYGFTMSHNATGSSATESTTISQLDGSGPPSLTCVASWTGSTATAITINTGPYLGSVPYPGAVVRGTHIAAGTTVLASPAPTAAGFSISPATAGTGSSATLTIDQWSSVGRAVTSFVTDLNGNALTAAEMDALSAWALTLRETNAIVPVQPPSYNTIYCTATIHVLPGYDPAATASDVVGVLVAHLAPATWGNPAVNRGTMTWYNSAQGFATVRYNSLIAIIEGVAGVQYVPPGSPGLAIGFSPSPSGTSDLAMTGPAPLPLSDNTTILVTTV